MPEEELELTILLPTYNEEEAICPVMDGILGHARAERQL